MFHLVQFLTQYSILTLAFVLWTGCVVCDWSMFQRLDAHDDSEADLESAILA